MGWVGLGLACAISDKHARRRNRGVDVHRLGQENGPVGASTRRLFGNQWGPKNVSRAPASLVTVKDAGRFLGHGKEEVNRVSSRSVGQLVSCVVAQSPAQGHALESAGCLGRQS